MNNYRAWLSWGIAASFVFYQFLLQASTSVMIPELVHAFVIDTAQLGVLSASFFYPYILLQIPAGLLVDRFGARLILIFSMIGCALSCWLFSAAHNVQVAELSRMLMGVTTSGGVVSAMYLAANWFPLSRFALLAGLTEMLGMLGGAIGQNILAFSTAAIGWRSTMVGCAALGMLLAILTIAAVSDGPTETHVTTAKKNILREFFQVLRLPQVWVNGIYGGLIFAIITGFAALWSVPFLMKLYNISLTLAAAASSMVFWGAALGGPAAGWINQYFPNRKVLMQLGAAIVLVICLLLFYLPAVPLPMMFIGLFALGFFCGVYVLVFAVVCEVVPQELRASSLGFTNMMCILFGAPILQPLIGGLLKLQQLPNTTTMNFTVDQYRIAFFVLPLGLLLALLSTVFICNKRD